MRAWLWNIIVWLDQGVNAFWGWALNRLFRVDVFGSPDETLSSCLGKVQHRCRACRWICLLLNRFDPQHCEKSIELDEGMPS